jgi:hypothetical protein
MMQIRRRTVFFLLAAFLFVQAERPMEDDDFDTDSAKDPDSQSDSSVYDESSPEEDSHSGADTVADSEEDSSSESEEDSASAAEEKSERSEASDLRPDAEVSSAGSSASSIGAHAEDDAGSDVKSYHHHALNMNVPDTIAEGFGTLRDKLQDKLTKNAQQIAQGAERAGKLASLVSGDIDKYHGDVQSISAHMKDMFSKAKDLHSHYSDLITGKEMVRLNAADASLLQQATAASIELRKGEDENQPKDDAALAERFGKL